MIRKYLQHNDIHFSGQYVNTNQHISLCYLHIYTNIHQRDAASDSKLESTERIKTKPMHRLQVTHLKTINLLFRTAY